MAKKIKPIPGFADTEIEDSEVDTAAPSVFSPDTSTAIVQAIASTSDIVLGLNLREASLIKEALGEYFSSRVAIDGGYRIVDVNDSIVLRDKLVTLMDAYAGKS